MKYNVLFNEGTVLHSRIIYAYYVAYFPWNVATFETYEDVSYSYLNARLNKRFYHSIRFTGFSKTIFFFFVFLKITLFVPQPCVRYITRHALGILKYEVYTSHYFLN